MHLLSKIVDQLIPQDLQDNGDWLYKFIYTNLHVRRKGDTEPKNTHLINPLNEKMGAFKPRNPPLSGTEKILGDFLTLRLGTHDNSVFLDEYKDQSELEMTILSDSGIFNPFTKYMFAIIDGEALAYRVTFQQNNKHVTFTKEKQFKCDYGNNGACDLSPYQNRKIYWNQKT